MGILNWMTWIFGKKVNAKTPDPIIEAADPVTERKSKYRYFKVDNYSPMADERIGYIRASPDLASGKRCRFTYPFEEDVSYMDVAGVGDIRHNFVSSTGVYNCRELSDGEYADNLHGVIGRLSDSMEKGSIKSRYGELKRLEELASGLEDSWAKKHAQNMLKGVRKDYIERRKVELRDNKRRNAELLEGLEMLSLKYNSAYELQEYVEKRYTKVADFIRRHGNGNAYSQIWAKARQMRIEEAVTV